MVDFADTEYFVMYTDEYFTDIVSSPYLTLDQVAGQYTEYYSVLVYQSVQLRFLDLSHFGSDSPRVCRLFIVTWAVHNVKPASRIVYCHYRNRKAGGNSTNCLYFQKKCPLYAGIKTGDNRVCSGGCTSVNAVQFLL